MDIDLIAKKFKGFKHIVKSDYIVSYPGIEFEAKIQATKESSAVKEILSNFKKNHIKIDEIIKRDEFHHFYKKGDIHRAFIFMRGSRDVWIKEKHQTKVLRTPILEAPILVRYEKKLKPKDRLYKKLFYETLYWHYEGSFQKECVDVSFWFENFLFTLTFANAIKNKIYFSQIEIEYDGHSKLARAPRKKTILKLFDDVISHIAPSQKPFLTTTTKLQWLNEFNIR